MHDTILADRSSYVLTESDLADGDMDHVSSTIRMWNNRQSGDFRYWGSCVQHPWF
jgi:hypothetical protein